MDLHLGNYTTILYIYIYVYIISLVRSVGKHLAQCLILEIEIQNKSIMFMYCVAEELFSELL